MPTVPIETVRPNPEQPRQYFDEVAHKELTASIKKDGQLLPILVGSDGIILDGECRYRACKASGCTDIEVKFYEGSRNPRVLSLIANLHRRDLSALEEANGIKAMIDEHGHAQKTVAKLLNKSPAYVSERLTLLKLPSAVQELVNSGKLSISHAKLLAKADPEKIEQLAKDTANKKTSVRKLKEQSEDSKSDPSQLVAKATKSIVKARALIDDALKTLNMVADDFDESAQFLLADSVEFFERADSKLEQFLKGDF